MSDLLRMDVDCSNLNQTMKMEPKEPSSTAPSPRDAINMAVTHYDMFTKGRVTEDVQFIAPCFVRWTVPPLGMVWSHPCPV